MDFRRTLFGMTRHSRLPTSGAKAGVSHVSVLCMYVGYGEVKPPHLPSPSATVTSRARKYCNYLVIPSCTSIAASGADAIIDSSVEGYSKVAKRLSILLRGCHGHVSQAYVHGLEYVLYGT